MPVSDKNIRVKVTFSRTEWEALKKESKKEKKKGRGGASTLVADAAREKYNL